MAVVAVLASSVGRVEVAVDVIPVDHLDDFAGRQDRHGAAHTVDAAVPVGDGLAGVLLEEAHQLVAALAHVELERGWLDAGMLGRRARAVVDALDEPTDDGHGFGSGSSISAR